MKQIRLIIAALSLSLSQVATAQTMKVYQGQVITAIPAATAADVVFAEGGGSFSVMGTTYPVTKVDRITFDHTTVAPRTVRVAYDDAQTWVTVSADIAPYLTVRAQGGHVSVVANPELQQEVTYELAGEASQGSFYMDGEYKATLLLSDLTLTNPDSAAINIANGKRIKVKIPAQTVTTLTDGVAGTQDACFFINGHAEFEGGGSLQLVGNTKHAYASDEYTQFKSDFGTFRVTKAVSDAMHIEQYLQLEGGTFYLSGQQGDGIDVGITKDPTDEWNGQAFIRGGKIVVDVAADDVKGLKTDSALTFTGGTIEATVSGLGTKGISVGTDLLIQQASDTPVLIKMNVTGTTYKPQDPVLESKCRGMKIKRDFTFDGGTIDMTVTGVKAKGISCDGQFIYVSGQTNVMPS